MKQEFLNLLGIIALFLIANLTYSQTNPNPNSALDTLILDEMNEEHFPGVSTVIVKDNRVVWINSYGYSDIAKGTPVSDTTVFLLASVSKLFTATAAMQLSENNGIDLEDDINQHLPWILQIPSFPADTVTIRQLMTHTASIRDNEAAMLNYYGYPDPTITLGDCMERYFSTAGSDYSATANFLSNPPGSVFEYSNMATALNGYCVEQASGIPFDEYCNIHIFDKLCMNKTAWFFADIDSTVAAIPYHFSGGNYLPYPHYGFADYPNGQLRSTATDLAHFMIAFLNGGNFGSNSILSPSSINQMWTPQIPSLDPYQGLSWYQEVLFHNGGAAWLWGHNGGMDGVSADMYLDPINKIGICVLANGEGDALNICDGLYNYALTLNVSSGSTPHCLTTNITETSPNLSEKKLIGIIDLLGRLSPLKPNTPLVKIFSDGSTERVFIIE